MSRKTSPGSNNDLPTAQVMPLIEFGRELQALFYQISEKFNDRFDQLKIQKMVNDAFALLAYANPAASPLSYLMDTSEREPIAAAVNSTILGSFYCVLTVFFQLKNSFLQKAKAYQRIRVSKF